jgi:predicted acylesterase/phospholipase RssA
LNLPQPENKQQRCGRVVVAAALSSASPAQPPEQQGLHPVLNLIAERLAARSRPGRRDDGFKLGLAVEGGGMRGIVTGAMLTALLSAGAGPPVFDAVYGASAGAINACYFLSGQPEGLDIYTRHLAASDRFLSLRRYWRLQQRGGGREWDEGGEGGGQGGGGEETAPALDLEYLLNEIIGGAVPLDWGAVLTSPVPLKVVASSLDTLRPEVLSDFDSARDLREVS